jgi:predicted nucleic acid-binding protein
MIVLDASVAVKWYLKEKGSEEADKLLVGEQRPVAPELIRAEVVAALCNQHRLYGKPKEQMALLCERWSSDLQEMSLRLFDHAPLMEQAWNIALSYQHALYDCIYLALAEQLGTPLVTADDAFVKKVKQRFPRAQLLPGMKDN